MNGILLCLPVFLPIVAGLAAYFIPFRTDRARCTLYAVIIGATTVLAWLAILQCDGSAFTFLRFTDSLHFTLRMDGAAKLFAGLSASLWPFTMVYAWDYMKHEGHKPMFWAFFTASFGVTLGIAFAANMMTMYLFYELLTLATIPLVMHAMTKQAIHAGVKYAAYSIAGAALAFIGMVFLIVNDAQEFVPGGHLAGYSGSMNLLLSVFVLAFVGCGVKAAIWPMHSWLISAAVAPTPVTALLHAVAVVKAGAFAVIRLSHYCFSPDLMRGTWAQTVCLIVAMFSIVFGSAMAVRERHMKRRLAYSTMSNLSYVLLGALMLTPEGLQGGLLHMVYHAIMKICLFSCVGAMMIRTGKCYVGEMRGMSRVMPFTMAVFLFCGIELVGIPPFVGFQSKWALATAALDCGALGIAAVAVLILSAVLTSIYMLAPAVSAYAMPLSPDSGLEGKRLDPGWRMQLPLILLVIVMLILVFASAPLAGYLGQVAAGLV